MPPHIIHHARRGGLVPYESLRRDIVATNYYSISFETLTNFSSRQRPKSIRTLNNYGDLTLICPDALNLI